MFCPYCGKKGVQNLEECPECGKSLIGLDKESEFKCLRCGRNVPSDAVFCWFCGEKLVEVVEGKPVDKKIPLVSEEKVSSPGTEFGTLLSYGKFIAGLGWFLVILGLIVCLIAIVGVGVGGFLMGLVIGGSLALSGLFYVIIGQSVSCFVSIEKYTRQTAYLLGKIVNKEVSLQ